MNCPTCGAAVDVEQASCASCGYALGNYRQPEAYFSALAAAYQQHRRFEEAVKAWQVIANLNPAYPHVYLYLGESHVGSGRPDRAIRTFEQALTQNPNSAPGHFALAELLRQQGERETAYPHYLKVTELEPGHGLAWLRLGQLYQQVNRRKEANQAYQRASKLLAQESVEGQQALQQLIHLRRELPATLVTGWSELLRQMTGPVVICLLVVLLDSGLRPWWIPWTGWLALLLGLIGAFLSISGTSLPRNPLMCLLAGEQGVSAPGLRVPVVLVGICCWLIALGLILLPLGTQAYPEIPPLPS
jgi:tetratricopeptide (TPR) repeat protein